MNVCKGTECGVSSDMADALTFGWGELDDYGYWEYPCAECARTHEKNNPDNGPCWPFERKE